MTEYFSHSEQRLHAALERFGLEERFAALGNGHTNGDHPAADIGEPTGWEPVDLGPILAGGTVTTSPTLFNRSDGIPLLYPGRCHSFNGEPETGKSWAAQLAAVQALAAGLTVSYLDFEDSPEGVTGRLLALGAERGHIAERFIYHRIDQPLSLEAIVVLETAIARHRPHLAIVDGVTEAMILCGLDPYSNGDVAKFWTQLPRRFTRASAATIIIDHVVKDRETRGRWAIGAQHKLAAIDGAAFTFDVVKPFGRGKTGTARVIVTKDRPGYLRQYAAQNDVIGLLKIHAWPDEHIDASLTAAGAVDDNIGWRPTVLMERVSRWVDEHPGMSKRSIRLAVKGDNNTIDLALELLVAEGYVAAAKSGRATAHTSQTPFRKPTEEPGSEDDAAF